MGTMYRAAGRPGGGGGGGANQSSPPDGVVIPSLRPGDSLCSIDYDEEPPDDSLVELLSAAGAAQNGRGPPRARRQSTTTTVADSSSMSKASSSTGGGGGPSGAPKPSVAYPPLMSATYRRPHLTWQEQRRSVQEEIANMAIVRARAISRAAAASRYGIVMLRGSWGIKWISQRVFEIRMLFRRCGCWWRNLLLGGGNQIRAPMSIVSGRQRFVRKLAGSVTPSFGPV